MIYCPINDNGIWKTRYSNELYAHYDEIDLVIVVKIGIWGGWDTSLECKNWILAESLLYLNQKTLDV
jgi:hypothetical protein